MTAADQDRVKDRITMAAEHLQSLRSLAAELERAMQAISRNAISEFEDSVAKQQVLSIRLTELAEGLCAPLEADPAQAQAGIDEDMKFQINSASDTLQQLNRRYAALLKHSSRSVALMASLFISFRDQFQEASGPGLQHRTWSCQM